MLTRCKKADFWHTILLDGMNFSFLFDRCKKYFFRVWLVAAATLKIWYFPTSRNTSRLTYLVYYKIIAS